MASKDSGPIQQPTVLFSIFQNIAWTIRGLVDETIDPATQPIMLKIVGFLNTYGVTFAKLFTNLISATLGNCHSVVK